VFTPCTFSCLGWCPKSNLLTRTNVQKFTSAQVQFSDFSRAYENMAGEKLTSKGPYTINIVFTNLICVSEVLIQKTASYRRTSNVAQIELVYKTVNGTNLESSNGETLILQSPRNNPIITESSPRCNIQGVDIRILKTDDDMPPSSVRVMVMGCSAQRE
jgi:hypothetical protein